MEKSNNSLELGESTFSPSQSPSRESNSSNLEDDLDFSSPNSSFGKNSDSKDILNQSTKQETSHMDTKPEEGAPSQSLEQPKASTSQEDQDKDKESPSSPKLPSELAAKPESSTPSTSGAGPSTSSGSPEDRKRKKSMDEDYKQEIIKRMKKQDEERMKMQVLVSNFSEEQLNRYEMFRRATFPRASIKRLMQSITGNTVSQNVVIAMSGISKVFVGEVLETALDVSEKWGDSGPLQPKHLREAVRILNAKGMLPSTKSKKSLF